MQKKFNLELVAQTDAHHIGIAIAETGGQNTRLMSRDIVAIGNEEVGIGQVKSPVPPMEARANTEQMAIICRHEIIGIYIVNGFLVKGVSARRSSQSVALYSKPMKGRQTSFQSLASE